MLMLEKSNRMLQEDREKLQLAKQEIDLLKAENMALEGWLLECYHEKTLEFVPIEPKGIKYAVTFFKEYNADGFTPPENLVYMWQVCETDGAMLSNPNARMLDMLIDSESCTCRLDGALSASDTSLSASASASD